MMTRVTASVVALVFAAAPTTACRSAAPVRAPAPPSYASALKEATDLPKRVERVVDWAIAPIDDANALSRELPAARRSFAAAGGDDGKLATACRAALTGEDPPPGALDGLTDDARRDAEALIERVGVVGSTLDQVPKRVAVAGLTMTKIVLTSPIVVQRAAKELKTKGPGALGGPADAGATLAQIRALPGDLRRLGPKLRRRMKAAPKDAAAAAATLRLALGPSPARARDSGPTDRPEPPADVQPGVVMGPVAGQLTPRTDGEALRSSLFGPPPASAVQTASPDARAQARAASLAARAGARTQVGDWIAAAQILEQAYFLDPTRGARALEVCSAAVRAGDCPAARRYATHTLERADSDQGLAAQARGVLDGACDPGRSAAAHAKRADALRAQAKKLLPRNGYGASRVYLEAAQARPDDARLARSAVAAARRVGDCRAAAEVLELWERPGTSDRTVEGLRDRLADCEPIAEDEEIRRASSSYAEGLSYAAKLDHREARRRFEWALAAQPSNRAYQLAVARASWAQGDCSRTGGLVADLAGSPTDLSPADRAWVEHTRRSIDDHGCPAARWHVTQASPRALARRTKRSGVDRPKPRPLQVAGWTMLGAGTGLAVGLVTAGNVSGRRARDAFALAADPDAARAAEQRYRSARGMLISGWVVGGIVAAAGVVAVVVDAVKHGRRKGRRSRVASSADSTGAGLGVAF